MKREISADDARLKFDELVARADRGEEFVISKDGKPPAVIVSTRIYESYRRAREERFARLDEIRSKLPDLPDEEVEADILAAIAEVRAEKAVRRAAGK